MAINSLVNLPIICISHIEADCVFVYHMWYLCACAECALGGTCVADELGVSMFTVIHEKTRWASQCCGTESRYYAKEVYTKATHEIASALCALSTVPANKVEAIQTTWRKAQSFSELLLTIEIQVVANVFDYLLFYWSRECITHVVVHTRDSLRIRIYSSHHLHVFVGVCQ